jgi:hypothetical protein
MSASLTFAGHRGTGAAGAFTRPSTGRRIPRSWAACSSTSGRAASRIGTTPNPITRADPNEESELLPYVGEALLVNCSARARGAQGEELHLVEFHHGAELGPQRAALACGRVAPEAFGLLGYEPDEVGPVLI